MLKLDCEGSPLSNRLFSGEPKFVIFGTRSQVTLHNTRSDQSFDTVVGNSKTFIAFLGLAATRFLQATVT